MKVIVAGDGKIGSTLTRHLAGEGYEITVIDLNEDVLEQTIEKYDVMSVNGNCATMSTLRAAGAETADIIVACTKADEVNLLCCITAHTINPKIHTIARIRNPEYYEQIYEMREKFSLSMSINPERQTAIEINRLLEYPGFLQRESFVKNRVEIVELRIDAKSKLKDVMLKDLDSVIKCQVLVCVVVRDGEAIMPDGNFELKEGDHLYVTAPLSELTTLLQNIGLISKKISRVLLAGGGRISFYLSRLLIASGIYVKIIESDRERCLELAKLLPEADIIHGDSTNTDILESEHASEFDAIVALTGLDEMNIIISVYAADFGIKQIVTKVARVASMAIVDRLSIGSVICPQELCGNIVVSYARSVENQTGAAVTVHSIAAGMAEALEFNVTADTKYLGVPLKDIRTRKNVLIVCISHGIQTEIPNGNSTFNEHDTVVIVTGSDTKILQLNDIFE